MPRPRTKILALLVCVLAGCAPRDFPDIPFRYSSSDHLAPSERFVSVEARPTEVAARIETIAHRAGGVVLLSDSDSSIRYFLSDASQQAFAARSRRAREEWRALAANDASLIAPPIGSHIEARDLVADQASAQSWHLRVELWSRSKSLVDEQSGTSSWVTPGGGTETFSYVWKDYTEHALSTWIDLRFWWDPELGRTWVHAEGRPVIEGTPSGEERMVERVWLPIVQAKQEARLVRLLLRQIASEEYAHD